MDTLKQLVREREVKVGRLETEVGNIYMITPRNDVYMNDNGKVEHMNNTITTYLDLANRENMSTPAGRKESKPEKPEKDCLVFHGVKVDDMERMTGDEDIRKNFLDHNIKNLLRAEWDIECAAPFKHVFRWINQHLQRQQ